MTKTDLLKGLQLFAGGEDVAIDSILDLLGDHGDMTANMSDEAVAMLVIASRFENIARVLEDINGALISMSGDIEALGECAWTNSFGDKFLRISGYVDAEK